MADANMGLFLFEDVPVKVKKHDGYRKQLFSDQIATLSGEVEEYYSTVASKTVHILFHF